MRRSGRVDPFLTVIPAQQTRQVIAQKSTSAGIASMYACPSNLKTLDLQC
jgi:hypothetical protein